MLRNILYNLRHTISAKVRRGAIALTRITTILCLILALVTIRPAIATITEIDIAPGQMHCRSEQVLKDEAGHKWQVMLFTHVNSAQVASLNLRLSGLSSSRHLQYRKPLIIITPSDRYEAPDIFLGKSPLPSIGQYDFKNIPLEIPTDDLVLEIPLENSKSASLHIPKAVAQEWLEVAAKNADAVEKLPPGFQLAC